MYDADKSFSDPAMSTVAFWYFNLLKTYLQQVEIPNTLPSL